MPDFSQYINERPELLLHPKQLMGVVKDVMGNRKAQYRAIQAALELGILDSLRVRCPLEQSERTRLIAAIQHDYAMVEKAAVFAVDFWDTHVSPELFDKADKANLTWEKESVPMSFSEPASQTSFSTHPVDDAPLLIVVKLDYLKNGISVQWQRHPKAERYQIFRIDSKKNSILLKEGVFPLPRYCDTDVEDGESYTYLLRAVIIKDGQEICSDYSNQLRIAALLKQRGFQIREIRAQQNQVQIRWNYQVAIQQYTVKMKQSGDVNWRTSVTLPATQFFYTDGNLTKGTNYIYKVVGLSRDNHMIETAEVEAVF